MASAFRRIAGRYVARFELDELTVVVMLLEQTRDLLVGDGAGAPAASPVGGTDEDEFVHLMRSAGWVDDAPPDGAPDVPAGERTRPPWLAPRPPAAGASDGSTGSDEPVDPALRRLLPDPNVTDPQASAEFRRLTGAGLRERKAATIHTAVLALSGAIAADAGPREPAHPKAEGGRRRRRRPHQITVQLDTPQAQALMVALTDVRLVLGERLELTTEGDADEVVHRLEHSLEPDDPLVAMAFAYDFLTWLQESLTQALLQG